MELNDKKWRDKLNQPSAEVPEQLDWEKMKGGILSKMEDVTTEQTTPTQSKISTYIFIVAIIVAILLLLRYCGHLPSGLQQNATVEQTAYTPSDAGLGVQDKGNNLRQNNQVQPQPSVYENKQVEESEKKNSEVVRIGGASISDRSGLQKTVQEAISSSDQTAPLLSERHITHSEEPEIQNTYSENVLVQKASITQKRKGELNPLPKLPWKEFDFTIHANLSKAPIYTEKELLSTRHRLGFASGMSIWAPTYSSILPDRAKFETQQISYSVQFHYQYYMKRNFYLITGLNLQQLQSRFDWSSTLENYKVTLSDVVVAEVTDAFTGQTDFVKGNITVEGEAERKVRNYNTTTLLQLPLGVGKEYQLGPLHLGLEIGCSINILGVSRGRTLYQNQVVALNQGGNQLFNSQWGINGFVGARLSYGISDQWSIDFGLSYQKAVNDWSLEENIQMRPQILQGSLGIGYQIR